jgi:hypothetical protein
MEKRRLVHGFERLIWKRGGGVREHERGVLVMERRSEIFGALFMWAVVVEDEWQFRA